MTQKCEPQFKGELDQIWAEIEYEDELSELSEQMEAQEIIDRAYLRSDLFGEGFYDGFFAGRQLFLKYEIARIKSIRQKHGQLSKRWIFDKL